MAARQETLQENDGEPVTAFGAAGRRPEGTGFDPDACPQCAYCDCSQTHREDRDRIQALEAALEYVETLYQLRVDRDLGAKPESDETQDGGQERR
jgi:hypothetical protein